MYVREYVCMSFVSVDVCMLVRMNGSMLFIINACVSVIGYTDVGNKHAYVDAYKHRHEMHLENSTYTQTYSHIHTNTHLKTQAKK
jgi:hypothetical protein